MCATTRWLGRPGKASPVSGLGGGVVVGVWVASCALEDIVVEVVCVLASWGRLLLWLPFIRSLGPAVTKQRQTKKLMTAKKLAEKENMSVTHAHVGRPP